MGGLLVDEFEQARPLVPAAFAYAARVARHGTITAAQMRGGLGFTVEADASLYLLRAKGWSLFGGDPAEDLIADPDHLGHVQGSRGGTGRWPARTRACSLLRRHPPDRRVFGRPSPAAPARRWAGLTSSSSNHVKN
jgi:hypothetical protein